VFLGSTGGDDETRLMACEVELGDDGDDIEALVEMDNAGNRPCVDGVGREDMRASCAASSSSSSSSSWWARGWSSWKASENLSLS